MTERNIAEVAHEYAALASSLNGFAHIGSLDAEFKALRSLEKELFEQGRIKEDPNLLLHMDITIGRQDAEDKVSGVVQGVETSPTGKLVAVVIKGRGKVDYSEGQTVILPHHEPAKV